MNKAELISKVHEEAKGAFTKAQSEQALNSVLDAISKTLITGEDIALTGFGSFKSVKRAERKGRNPRTGEEMTIAASTNVKFTLGKTLKDALK